MAEKGYVKKYFPDKGFGFIVNENYMQGLFFHISGISTKEEKENIKEGLLVEYNIEKDGKNNKKFAKEIRIIYPYLPKDTLKDLEINKIDNLYLSLNKVSFYDEKNFELHKNDNSIINLNTFNISNIINRQMKLIKEMNIITKTTVFTSSWRLILGLGNESVHETSITLHHIYGIPYIPGQSIKGMLRNFIIYNVFYDQYYDEIKDLEDEKKGKELEKKALGSKNFVEIFGDEEHKGNVHFFDAFPTKFNIEMDIMNPHYSEYYQENSKPPADYQNPVIINFLTVENAEFNIYLGVKNNYDKNIEIGECKGPILDVTYQWLKKALAEHGIGAKTSAGYGYGILE